jgi:hypothetical protein
MKILTAAAVALMLGVSPAWGAESAGAPDRDAVATLAGILAGMHHFPTAEQKATLERIAGDGDVDKDLRIVAGAIDNVQHQVPDADRAALQAIVDDPSSSEAARTLAGAVLRFKHRVTEQDAAALSALSG